MKTMKFAAVLAIAVLVTAFFTLCHAAEKAGADRPILRPETALDSAGQPLAGIRVDFLSLAKAKRPTRKVYVEEAVALWRPAYGEQIAAAGSTEAQDVTAAVAKTEQEKPKSWSEIAADHLANNAGRYIGGAVLVAVGAGGYALYEANKSGGTPKTTISIPPTDARQSPPVSVTAGDNSPVNVSVVITAMPPE